MSQSHGTPAASVVSLLLLLCLTHSGLGKNCVFTHQPLPTTDMSSTIHDLKKLLLLDYPVSLPANLKPDDHCFALWQLHFISRELRRMQPVAGSELGQRLFDLESGLSLQELFKDCRLQSDCVEFERSNISVFLDSIPPALQEGNSRMEGRQDPLDFSNCTSVQCESGPLSTPFPGYSAQALETMQASKSGSLRRHHWLLIPIPLLACLFSAVKFSGRAPVQPLPLQV